MSGSLFHRTYYTVKPWLPKRFRNVVRSAVARRQRSASSGIWPILSGSEVLPLNWRGWPEGKEFAFVLTHDVEGWVGLERCRQLAELEIESGFRSSFNFVPEGEYAVPNDLRDWLVANGFEVGVHDHKHDGKLYRSRAAFGQGAEVINRHLKEWNAAGFRAGFMFHNLDWLHDLDALYDASTFDADPFEPLPKGVGTIFPFWVPCSDEKSPGEARSSTCEKLGNAEAIQNRESRSKIKERLPSGSEARGGYVELPYTLPQDFTLFSLLQEGSIDLWKKKLDWIAEHGGMALVIVHPDYVSFEKDGAVRAGEYPASFYRQLLEYVQRRYPGRYWACLPRDMAQFVMKNRDALLRAPSSPLRSERSGVGKTPAKIWIDLDNTPHVPFFKPIISELERRGHKVVLTARDAFQVSEMADRCGLRCEKVGHHYGKHMLLKFWGLIWRSLQLAPFALREKPILALSHGARSQLFLANLLRVPTVLMYDYEHAKSPPFCHPRWRIAPEAVLTGHPVTSNGRVRKYQGIKEDVYVPDFVPDPGILSELGLSSEDLVVTVRPPASEAHYRNPESDVLFAALMERSCNTDEVRVVLLPRNHRQEEEIRNRWPHWFENRKTIVPKSAVDGLNLLWFSDLVVSGGGTMNREAAALGVPVYSIFRGKTGAVDRQLETENRLVIIRNLTEVQKSIVFRRRDKTLRHDAGNRAALMQIVEHIEEILHLEMRRRAGDHGDRTRV